MPETKQIVKPTPYASCADFRRIFDEDMNSLYRLALLLTADRETAEQCFVSGLDDAVEGNRVFREWARSWARRAIIQNAVRVINPRPGDESGRRNSAPVDRDDETQPAERQAQIAAVLRLAPFERFVYVMTVLEHYSDHECSLVLGCARRDVIAARTRAMQHLGAAMEMHYQQISNASVPSGALQERRGAVLKLLAPLRLATSA